MSNKNKKLLENIESKTKIYLVIIAIILIVLCYYQPVYIIPSIILYTAIILYTIWVYNKRKGEVASYINDLTISMESAAKNTLINSPFPLIILETDIDNNNIPNIDKMVNIENKTYHIIGDYVKIKQKDKKKTNKYMTILYFVDKTEVEELSKKYEDSKTCIGIVMIDNYDEIIQRILPEEKPQLMAKIEKKLYDWAAKTGGVMIKTERDTFVYVFEQEFLSEMQNDKFIILDCYM